MSTAAQSSAHEQNMAQVAQIGVVAQANFVEINKIVTFDFLEARRVIGLTEAVGVREVASKSVPAGPTSPG